MKAAATSRLQCAANRETSTRCKAISKQTAGVSTSDIKVVANYKGPPAGSRLCFNGQSPGPRTCYRDESYIQRTFTSDERSGATPASSKRHHGDAGVPHRETHWRRRTFPQNLQFQNSKILYSQAGRPRSSGPPCPNGNQRENGHLSMRTGLNRREPSVRSMCSTPNALSSRSARLRMRSGFLEFFRIVSDRDRPRGKRKTILPETSFCSIKRRRLWVQILKSLIYGARFRATGSRGESPTKIAHGNHDAVCSSWKTISLKLM